MIVAVFVKTSKRTHKKGVYLLFTGFLKFMLKLINALLTSTINSTLLSSTLQAFNPTMYSYVNSILSGAVRTVAYMLLSLFFMLELLKVSTKTEGMSNGSVSVEVVFRTLFKMVICKMAVDLVATIMNAVYNLSIYLVNGIRSVMGAGAAYSVLDMNSLNSQIDSMGLGDQIGALLISFFVLVVVAIVVLIVDVIVIARFIEIYIFFSVAAIPLATLAHEEHSNVAKSFLKSFAAVCLQGALILIVMSFFPLLLNTAFLEGADDGTVIIKLLSVLGYSFILGLGVLSSQKWAKAICNVM